MTVAKREMGDGVPLQHVYILTAPAKTGSPQFMFTVLSHNIIYKPTTKIVYQL